MAALLAVLLGWPSSIGVLFVVMRQDVTDCLGQLSIVMPAGLFERLLTGYYKVR